MSTTLGPEVMEAAVEAALRADVRADRAFGLYDYSSYPGDAPPHVVRDERTGDVVFRSNDPEAAVQEYERLRKQARREFFAAALAEAGHVVEQGWQDIASAPKDGTDILVYCADSAEQFVAYWSADDRVFIYALHTRGKVGCLPSSWRPLPAPPAPAAPPAHGATND